jgi:SNF2 family DNA or RNA helicase
MSTSENVSAAATTYASNIFCNILVNQDSLLDLDLPGSSGSSRTSFFKKLFPQDQVNCRKRNLQEFLEDWEKDTDHEIVPDEENDEGNAELSGDLDERSPEIMEALYALQFPIDKLFRKVLKYHQIEGLQFMWERVYVKKQGCLLAHSMGLGKTLQVISLLTTMYQHLKRNPESNFPTVCMKKWRLTYRYFKLNHSAT